MKTLKQRIAGLMYREFEFRAEHIIDADERLIRVVASTEFQVLRQSFFSAPWFETLGHKRTEVDLTRLKKGAPVLYNHNRTRADRVGVVESATLNTKDRQVEAVIRISKRPDVDDIWTDLSDGILKNISMGYQVNERTLIREGRGEPDEFRITSWSPAEISLVDVGADPNAQVGRELDDNLHYRIFDIQETNEMKYDNDGNPIPENDADRAAITAGTATRQDGSVYTPPAPVVASPAPANVTNITEADKDAARAEGRREGAGLEHTRVADINALFEPFGDTYDEIRTTALDDKEATADTTRKLLLDELGKGSESVGGESQRIELIEDNVTKFIRAGSIAIAVRAGIATDEQREEVAKTGFRGFTLYELARRSLELANVRTDRFSKMELVGRAFTTSDFPLLLQDASNKSMLNGWDESPESWDQWANTGELSDFKVGNRVNISSFNDLTLVNEDGEYTYGSFEDEGQTIQLATFGKLFAISRQAIINDDLSAFTRIPSAMGRAAARVVGDLAYGVLTANANLSDGIALFDGTAIGTTHGNLNLGGAGVITGVRIDSMRVAMGRQTDASSSATALNIRPAFFLVPMAIESVAKVLMASEFDPADGTNNNRAPNSVRGLMVVVSDARLDIDSATRFYMTAGKGGDTVEVAFLDGNQAPTLEQQAGWSIDGVEYKVRLDVAAAAMDFRGMQRNDGV